MSATIPGSTGQPGDFWWCFDPGHTASTCPSPLIHSCPDSTVAGPGPCAVLHTETRAVAVPHAGATVPWGGLDLVVMGLGLLLAAAPPFVSCPVCGRRMPAWRLKEGGCKPCVRRRAEAAVDLLRP